MFPNIYNRALVALLVISSPLWFLPFILVRAARESGLWFEIAGDRFAELKDDFQDERVTAGLAVRIAVDIIKELLVDVISEIAAEAHIAKEELAEEFAYSIGNPLVSAKNAVVNVATTAALLALIGLDRVRESIVGFLKNQVVPRIVALGFTVLIPVVAVCIIYDEGARGLFRELVIAYRDGLRSVVTGESIL